MGCVCVSMTCIVQKMQDSFELLLKKWSPVYVGCNLFLSSSWSPCSHINLFKMSLSFPSSSLLLCQTTWEQQELPGTPLCQALNEQGAKESPARVKSSLSMQADTDSGLARQQDNTPSPKSPGHYAETCVTDFHSPDLSILTWVSIHLSDVLLCCPFGHIKVAGRKSHPICRLCFTQKHFMVSLGGLSRSSSYVWGGTWLCYGCYVVHCWCKWCPQQCLPLCYLRYICSCIDYIPVEPVTEREI